MRNKTRLSLILSIVVLLIILPIISSAQVPRTINYQSYLTGSDSNPVNETVSITFSIYNVVSGSTSLWSQTQDVAVSQGIYSVVLGGGLTPNPITLPFDVPYWLGVQVGSDIEMTPRQPLTSVPYALNSDTADYSLDSARVGGLDSSALQNRVSGVCGAGFSIRQVNQDGSVVCEQDDGITSETDPTVNTLAKAILNCQDGENVQWNGSAWVCNTPGPACNTGDFMNCYASSRDTIGIGECKFGVRECTAQGSFGDCIDAVIPATEVCDLKDNNCDGNTDEGIAPVDDGNPCTNDECINGVINAPTINSGCDDGNPSTDGLCNGAGECKSFTSIICSNDYDCELQQPGSYCLFILSVGFCSF